MLKKIKNQFKTKDVSIIAPTKLRDDTGMSSGLIIHDLLMQTNSKLIITDPKLERKDEKRVNSTE